MHEIEAFVERLANLTPKPREVELAVALLWFADRAEQGVARSVKELADLLHGLGLTNEVKRSRLRERLGKHPDTVRGKGKETFRIRTTRRAGLDDRFSALVGPKRVRPTDSVVPRDQFKGRREALCELVAEINACFDHGFYDGAAVLCRRLVEALIVDAFKAKKAEAAIKKGKDYMLLEELIGVINSGQHIRLTRSARPGLEPIRHIGNVAAHSPYHITKREDVNGIAHHVRVLVSELLAMTDGT